MSAKLRVLLPCSCIRMLASSLGARVAPDDWVKLLPLEESAHQTTPDGKEKLPDDVVQNEVAIVETGHSNLPSGASRCVFIMHMHNHLLLLI